MTGADVTPHKWPPREGETRTDAQGRVIGLTLYRIYGGGRNVPGNAYRDELFLCDICRQWVKVAEKDGPCKGKRR